MRFSSKIMSPSFALASVIGLSAGVNDLITSAEKRGTGAAPGTGVCARTRSPIARKISTAKKRQLILAPTSRHPIRDAATVGCTGPVLVNEWLLVAGLQKSAWRLTLRRVAGFAG